MSHRVRAGQIRSYVGRCRLPAAGRLWIIFERSQLVATAFSNTCGATRCFPGNSSASCRLQSYPAEPYSHPIPASRCLHNASPLTWNDAVESSAALHAKTLTDSCGDLFHSEREDRNGYGENLYVCWGTETCYSHERAMEGLCEFLRGCVNRITVLVFCQTLKCFCFGHPARASW